MMKKALALIAAGLLNFGAAQAATLVNGTGLTNPGTVVTFDGSSLVPGNVAGNAFAAQGVTFSPDLRFNIQGGAVFPGITGNYLGNQGGISTYSILFNRTVNDVAFGFATNFTTTTITSLLNGSIVESFTQATSFDVVETAFLGFTNTAINEIRVTIGGDGLSLIDNIQISAVPLPAGGLLLIGGLGVLGALRRRKA